VADDGLLSHDPSLPSSVVAGQAVSRASAGKLHRGRKRGDEQIDESDALGSDLPGSGDEFGSEAVAALVGEPSMLLASGPSATGVGLGTAGGEAQAPGAAAGAAGLSVDAASVINAGIESGMRFPLLAIGGALGLAGALLARSSQGSGRGTPPAPTAVVLDPTDDADPSNGSTVRIEFDRTRLSAGDLVYLKVQLDGPGSDDPVAFDNSATPYRLTTQDIANGFIKLQTAPLEQEGTYRGEAYFKYPDGPAGPATLTARLLVLFSGVVHDDYMAGSAVFIDQNRDGKFTFTDTNGNGVFDVGEPSEPQT
jgi:hypothetical protein